MAGLRDVAAQDMAFIIEGDALGNRWPVTIKSPGDMEVPLFGFTNDIFQAIDRETGQIISGRNASVSLRIDSITAAGLTLPYGVASAAGKPWRVTFDDIHGTAYTFKIAETMPDRTIGVIVCLLEAYRD